MKGRQHLLLRAPHPRLILRGGPLVPPWQGGLLGGGLLGHLLLVEGGSIFSTFWGPHSYTGVGRPTAPHRILRRRQIPKLSCRTITETAAVAIFPPPQAFLAHFARFVPILCAVKPI